METPQRCPDRHWRGCSREKPRAAAKPVQGRMSQRDATIRLQSESMSRRATRNPDTNTHASWDAHSLARSAADRPKTLARPVSRAHSSRLTLFVDQPLEKALANWLVGRSAKQSR